MTNKAKMLLHFLKTAQSQGEFHAAEVLAYAYQSQLKHKRDKAQLATKQFVENQLKPKEQAGTATAADQLRFEALEKIWDEADFTYKFFAQNLDHAIRQGRFPSLNGELPALVFLD